MLYDINDVNYDANLVYEVFFYDFNNKKLVGKNIFYKGAIEEIIRNIKRKINLPTDVKYENLDYAMKLTDIQPERYNIIDIKEAIESWAKYNYWSRAEYELMIGDLYEEDTSKYEKVDIYKQIMLNLDLITKYFCFNVFIKAETDETSVNNEDDKDREIKELSEQIDNLKSQVKKLRLQDIPYLNGYIDGMREFQELN